MKLKNHVYDRDVVVVGGSLQSLLIGVLEDAPVVFADPSPPDRFKKLPGSSKTQLELWEKLMLFMGIDGQIPFSGLCRNIRISGDQLDITTNRYRKSSMKFKKLIICDDRQVNGLPPATKEEKDKNLVVDWVNVRSGCTHEFDELSSGDDFVNKVCFYPTDRSDNKSFKDLAAISYLTDGELEDFDFSDTMVKFKVQKMMKDAGIKGARNGRDVNNPSKFKYYAVKIEPSQREVFERARRHYAPADWFEVRHKTVEDLLKKGDILDKVCSRICELL